MFMKSVTRNRPRPRPRPRLPMEHNLSVGGGGSDHQDSKTCSSFDETSGDQNNDTLGTGRSYECVFCKRGFTTAQALGGHMNIHRKDRVKSKTISTGTTSSSSFSSSSSSPSSIAGYYSNSRANQVTQNFPSSHSHHLSMPSNSELHINYQTYLPSSTWSLGSSTTTTTSQSQDKDELLYHHHHVHNNPDQFLNIAFKENWHRNPSTTTQVPAGAASHTLEDKRSSPGNAAEEDELDLELRLGHDR